MKQIIIDCNYLCWTSYFNMRKLRVQTEEGDVPTGVIFGFLRQILAEARLFKSNEFYFCFDGVGNIRKELFEGYKSGRHKDTDSYEIVNQQIQLLQMEVLPQLGFRNIYVQDGYEADDIIAMIVKQFCGEEKVVIVSGDEDLFQLLGTNVEQYIPTKNLLYTEKDFRKQNGFGPEVWADYKAIAGCSSDKIPGVVGLGPKKTGELLRSDKGVKGLPAEQHQTYRDFLKLTKLPIPGTRKVGFWEDELSYAPFLDVCTKYRFDSLLTHDSEAYLRFVEGDFSTGTERVSKKLKRGRRKGLIYDAKKK